MADYGMTNSGFIPKRLADIRNDLITDIQAIQDPETGEYPFINIDDDSIIAMLVGAFSEQLAAAWDAAYEGYKQFDPLQNTGAGQSATVQLNGITRSWGAGSELSFELEGLAGYTVPKGSLISDQQNVYQFATITAATFGTNGKATVTGVCQTKGALTFTAGQINTIQSPMYGWNSATNIAQLTVGTPEETDEQLRERQQVSTSLTSYRQVEAIYAALRAIDGTRFVRVLVNSQDSPKDSRGIPFKEVAALVEGGDADEICDALFKRFPVGVVGYGEVTRTRYDIQGIAYPISFSRPQDVPVYVEVDITITDRAAYPDNAPDLIKQNIVAYSEYAGSEDKGFPPGENIIRTRLYTPVNDVPGFGVLSLKIGTSASSLSENDITIDWNKVARFDVSRIIVKVDGVEANGI